MAKQLRVAMVAPPWLPIPPAGYGGIESVLHALVPELMKLGVHVELFTIGATTMRSSKKHWLYKDGQYDYIHRPYYDNLPILIAHLTFALNKIRKDGKFDLIHDHNSYIGPLAFANAHDLPPVVHTLHGPPFTTEDRIAAGIPDNHPMWSQFSKWKNVSLIPISKAMTKVAPAAIKGRLLPFVHNMLDVRHFPFKKKKEAHFITLARFHPDKGQAIAVEACLDLGYKLRMAGSVENINKPRQLLKELANPASPYRSSEAFQYYSNKIFPHVNGKVTYVGEVVGKEKLEFISTAKALLFPIQWEEPFGMAVIEALACGTPVVAMNRGAMPEIIEHGVNGFLANDVAEFKECMQRVDEINPADCRESVKRKFSAKKSAMQYLERYNMAIARNK